MSADQHNDVTQQLNDGIRLLQSQGHKAVLSTTDNIELCHTSCALFSTLLFIADGRYEGGSVDFIFVEGQDMVRCKSLRRYYTLPGSRINVQS